VLAAVVRREKYTPTTSTAEHANAIHDGVDFRAFAASQTSQSTSPATPASLLSSASRQQAAAPITFHEAGRSPRFNPPSRCACAIRASAEKTNSAASGSARPLTYVTALVCSGWIAQSNAPPSAHAPPPGPSHARKNASSATAASACTRTLVKCQPGCGAARTARASAESPVSGAFVRDAVAESGARLIPQSA